MAQSFENPLPVPGIVRFVVENELEIGQAEERKRTQVNDLRDPVHDDLKRNRYLLFDLLRGNSRPLGNNLDVVIRHVGIRFDGQALKRNDPAGEKDQRQAYDEQSIAKSKINDATNHLLLHRVL